MRSRKATLEARVRNAIQALDALGRSQYDPTIGEQMRIGAALDDALARAKDRLAECPVVFRLEVGK